MSRATEGLARSVVDRAKHEAHKARLDHQLARVVRVSPLTVELLSTGKQLVDDEDLILSNDVEIYNRAKEGGIKVDDNLLVHRASGQWVATDVLHDRKAPVSVTKAESEEIAATVSKPIAEEVTASAAAKLPSPMILARAATAAALPTNTLVGNVLEATANAALAAQDGITLSVGDRLLVWKEAEGKKNGVYEVTSLGAAGAKYVLTRISAMNESAEIVAGMLIAVSEGTLYADTVWQLTTDAPIVLNTTALVFALTDRTNKPACRVYKAAGQGVANGTLVTLTFDSERFDNDSMHSTVSNTSRIVFNKPGVYDIQGQFGFLATGSAVAIGFAEIRLNGATTISSSRFANDASGNIEGTISITEKFAVGDYIELRAFHNAGAEKNTGTNARAPQEFSAAYLGEG